MKKNYNKKQLPILHFVEASEFCIIHRETTSTLRFLASITNKKSWRWRFVRNVFTGREDVSLTIVDKSVDTPFRCLLLALFVKQLKDDFSFGYRKLTVYVTPLPSESHVGTSVANERFGTTIQRNTYLQQCLKRIVGMEAKLKCKRFIINKRDSKLSSKDFDLFIRVNNGISHGWYADDAKTECMTPIQLLDKHESDIPCYNILSCSGHKSGVLINLDLQPNFK